MSGRQYFFDFERSIYEERRGIGVIIESSKVPTSHISKQQRTNHIISHIYGTKD
jgi:hypothetical protein